MEKIRQRACDGLLALPRVGMGVGGLLIGESVVSEGEEGEGQCLSIRLRGSIDIPCSHAAGPAFRLTAEEIQQSRELMARSPRSIVGWYCSKTRGAAALGEAELALHRELFPEPGRIALIIRPSTVEPTQAAFFFADQNGKVVKGIEADLDEWVAEDDSEKEASQFDLPPLVREPQAAPAVEREPAPAATPEVRLPVPAVTSQPRPPVPARTSEPHPPAPAPHRKPLTAPSFGYSDTPPGQRRRFRMIAVIAVLVTGVLAFLTQDFWLPRPPLRLAVSDANGALTIRWNASAVRGFDSASLFVNDGGKLRTLPLDRFVLKRGFLVYEPISVRVTATLSAGDSKAMIVWFAPAANPAPDSTPALQPAIRTPAAQVPVPQAPSPQIPAPAAPIGGVGR
jgi:hypothetical protein